MVARELLGQDNKIKGGVSGLKKSRFFPLGK